MRRPWSAARPCGTGDRRLTVLTSTARIADTGRVMPAPAAPPTPLAPKTGRAGIVIGIVLLVVGIVGGIALVVAGAQGLVRGVDDLERVPISGGIVEVDEAGPVKVYAERDVSRDAAASYSSSSSGGPVPDVDIVVTGATGEPIPVERVDGSEEYQDVGHWGTRVGRFDAPEAGTYAVVVTGGDDVGRYDTIAVGNDISASGLWMLVAGILGGGFLVVVGAIVLTVSLIRRGRARKRAQHPPSYPPSGYPPPGYGPPVQPGSGAYPPGPPPPGARPPAAGPTQPGWPAPPT